MDMEFVMRLGFQMQHRKTAPTKVTVYFVLENGRDAFKPTST